MTLYEFILKWSAEGRAWATLLLPVVSALITGWHLPQPKWVTKNG